MTNSHNRATPKEGRNSERNNASPNHQKNGGNSQQQQQSRKVTYFNDNNKNHSSNNSNSNSNSNSNNNSNNNNKGYYAQKHSSNNAAPYFSTSPKDIIMPPNHIKNRHHHNQQNQNQQQQQQPQQQQQQQQHNGSPHGFGRSPARSPISFASPAGVSTTTPNLHFAGSKYFDAPSPNALPRPPSNWTSSTSNIIMFAPAATIDSATTKRRLFPTDTINQKPCSLMAADAAGKNLCSDIFSHNLKLILNVQA